MGAMRDHRDRCAKGTLGPVRGAYCILPGMSRMAAGRHGMKANIRFDHAGITR